MVCRGEKNVEAFGGQKANNSHEYLLFYPKSLEQHIVTQQLFSNVYHVPSTLLALELP